MSAEALRSSGDIQFFSDHRRTGERNGAGRLSVIYLQLFDCTVIQHSYSLFHNVTLRLQ